MPRRRWFLKHDTIELYVRPVPQRTKRNHYKCGIETNLEK